MTTDYTSILESTKLGTLKLVSTASAVHPFYSFGEQGGILHIETGWTQETFIPEKKTILASCEWLFECQAKGFEEAPVSVQANYLIEYRDVGKDEAIASAYLKDVGRMAVYPYFRAHVAALLSEASMILPTLPVINIATFRKTSRISAAFSPKGAVPAVPSFPGG